MSRQESHTSKIKQPRLWEFNVLYLLMLSFNSYNKNTHNNIPTPLNDPPTHNGKLSALFAEGFSLSAEGSDSQLTSILLHRTCLMVFGGNYYWNLLNRHWNCAKFLSTHHTSSFSIQTNTLHSQPKRTEAQNHQSTETFTNGCCSKHEV